jgi:outer membrane receptor protein involved in Fe transport
MKKLLLFGLLTCFLTPIFGQITIEGRITDDKNQPIAFASVALIAAKDSHLVKGGLSAENGFYTIPSLSAGSYRILASSVGFEKTYTPIFEIKNDSKTATIDITLPDLSKVLDAAVVTAARPLFEQKADRLVVNVANSPIAAGGTAMEILQKVPGVLIIQEKVTLAGSQNVQVWIDGKPSPYQDVNAALRDMPGDQIDRIELITNPGARYDAAGGPILNIILKRNAELGFTGSAQLTLGGFRVNQNDVNGDIQNYYRINPSVNVNYRGGGWNLFGGATFNNGTYFNVIKVNRYIGSETFRSGNFDQTIYTFGNLRFGADYYATKKTTFGILLKAWQREGNGEASNLTEVFAASTNQKFSEFVTDNNANSKRKSVAANFNMKHEFDSKTGHSLNFDMDYNHFDLRNINDLSIYPNTLSSFVSRSRQDIHQPVNLWVSKLDYSLPIDTTLKVETGIKLSFATINNDLNFYRANERSDRESNEFLYQENINAAYINANKKVKKLEFNAGLRVEQTIAKGTTQNAKVLDRNYTQFFPNMSLLYRLNKGLGVQAAYSKRVNRPSFQQQNPFNNFIDSLTYTRGNPQLRPEIAHSAALSLVFDGQPVAGIEYNRIDDVIIDNAPQLEGTKTFTTADNLAKQEKWTFQLNFPIKIKKWLDGFGGNQVIYNSYKADYQGLRYEASRWHWLAYWGVTANLPNEIKLECNGFYMTKFLEEFLTINRIAGVNLGVSKSFWDKRGRISLNVNDIFYTQPTNATIDLNNIKVDFFQREYSRNARLTFRYQFGNTKVKNSRNRQTGSESETSRIKVD